MEYACYHILVPEDPMELVKKVPKYWNCIDWAQLTYEGTKKHQGRLLYDKGEGEWQNDSLEEIIKGEICVPSEITFLKHVDKGFFSKVKNKLLPAFVENGYTLRNFRALWVSESYPYNEIAGIHFYEDRELGRPLKWTGKWTALIFSEDLMKSIKVYKKYIIRRSV
jgi:hypothetical protein